MICARIAIGLTNIFGIKCFCFRAADESYRQISAAPAAAGGSGGPAVIALAPGAQHLQYNSPLGLYSKSNVQQAISGQPGAANGT